MDSEIVLYVWRSSIDGEIYNGSEDIIELEPLTPGDHVIYFKVKDEEDLWSEEVDSTLTVTPNRKPIVVITTPIDGEEIESAFMTIAGTATDPGARYGSPMS